MSTAAHGDNVQSFEKQANDEENGRERMLVLAWVIKA